MFEDGVQARSVGISQQCDGVYKKRSGVVFEDGVQARSVGIIPASQQCDGIEEEEWCGVRVGGMMYKRRGEMCESAFHARDDMMMRASKYDERAHTCTRGGVKCARVRSTRAMI